MPRARDGDEAGRSDQIGVDVWMPLSGWNGRFQGVGSFGCTTGSPNSLAGPVAAGYSAAVTDGGHGGLSNQTGSFALDARRPLRLGVDPGLLLSRSARPRGGGEGMTAGLRDGGEARLLERLLDWRSPGAGAGTALPGGLRRDSRRSACNQLSEDRTRNALASARHAQRRKRPAPVQVRRVSAGRDPGVRQRRRRRRRRRDRGSARMRSTRAARRDEHRLRTITAQDAAVVTKIVAVHHRRGVSLVRADLGLFVQRPALPASPTRFHLRVARLKLRSRSLWLISGRVQQCCRSGHPSTAPGTGRRRRTTSTTSSSSSPSSCSRTSSERTIPTSLHSRRRAGEDRDLARPGRPADLPAGVDRLLPTRPEISRAAREDEGLRAPVPAAPGVAHCSGGPGPQPDGPLNAVVEWVENGKARRP